MMPALCPYCETPLRADQRTCNASLCLQASAELARGMLCGEEDDIAGWRRHYRRHKALIAEREKELRKEGIRRWDARRQQ